MQRFPSAQFDDIIAHASRIQV